MRNLLRLVALLAITFCVSGRVSRASHLSNKREVSNLCAESLITPVSCGNAGELGLLPHPDDCRLFYQCAYGIPFCHHCPPSLHFNPTLLLCDKPDHAGCVIGTTPSTSSIVISTTEAWNDNNEESPASHNEIPPRCRANSVTRVSCAEAASPDALLPHPDDCALFYYCVSAASAPVCRQCPADLYFNPELHVCDVPQHAGCKAGNSAAVLVASLERLADLQRVFF